MGASNVPWQQSRPTASWTIFTGAEAPHDYLVFYCLLLCILMSYHVFVFINNEPIVCYHFSYCLFYRFSLFQLWAYFFSL